MFLYLRNEREPNVEALIKLKETMNIDMNWLLTGEGKVYRSLPNDELEVKEQALINHYRMIRKLRLMWRLKYYLRCINYLLSNAESIIINKRSLDMIFHFAD